ncbi:triose-phosphate isomerase [Candidatus Uabimicrobium amorphum]|uniref:Triosephosphate isomerase n=1 Tax=Uabimicrobium amorphum TaxID=2596890 RepID=A0A5S9IL57_UABAM|nr:triose-phosphate isomerase [Candidatus Uabimicrobium amorphum]BBM83560.1 triosephosphate isomerase [Candidatus Uabimicrobium amorphum]
MRRIFIAGNWKMNTSSTEAQQLIEAIYAQTNDHEMDIAVCPPTVYLSAVSSYIKSNEQRKNLQIKLGAQNMHWEDKGAFTGEVSGQMLQDVGCTYVVLGHSERRALFSETNENINKKIHKALAIGLLPILCIGETLEERESGKEKEVITEQLTMGLKDLSPSQVETCTVAYEPVWAIGTGKTASPEMAQDMHAFIRQMLAQNYGDNVAQAVRIQYGGSVKPQNIKDLIAQADIDGALIGGASLKADSFSEIISICSA